MAGQNQSGNSLDALASMLQLFQGSKKSETVSGGTTTETATEKSNLGQEDLAALLKTALEGNAGLAQVSSGQKSSGLYNSSTNRLLTNDLLARLTANAAQAGAGKTTTRTSTAPNRVTTTAAPGALQGNAGKLLTAYGAYKKLAGDKGPVGSAVAGATDSVTDFFGLGGSETISGADIATANQSPDAIASLFQSQDWGAASEYAGTALDYAGLGGDEFQTFAPEGWLDSGDTASSIGETASNFPTASATGGTSSSLASNSGSSASAAEASSAGINTASVVGGATALSSSADTASSLGTATEGINYGSNTASSLGSLDVGYDISAGADAATAADATAGGMGTAGSGSALGYVGPVLNAVYAQNNPEGAQNKDYRKAVGGAILNYFGFGWATPIVDAVAKPVLNAATDAGYESGGVAGAVVADPVGSLISGEYEFGDVIRSAFDPGDIFGGNEGGSVGAVAAYGLDPVGAALGDKGVFGAASSAINSVDSALSPGRVVCTELALSGHIPMEKYQAVIAPNITLKGRVLLGYHMLGIPAVRKLRADPRFLARALPYVNAYLDHKLGQHNLIGFIIKSLGEPLCWILSFFNKDPEAYKTLYPYRRNRNGART